MAINTLHTDRHASTPFRNMRSPLIVAGAAVAGGILTLVSWAAGGLIAAWTCVVCAFSLAGVVWVGSQWRTQQHVQTVALTHDAQTPGDDAAAPETETSESVVFGHRILIAEDNPLNQKIAIAMLASQGYHYELAENGQIALEKVEAGDFGLVLMDIQMPVMDGIEATRRIRALPNAKAHIPIVAVTANAMQGDRETYLEAGMNDFVPKPVDPQSLLGIVSCYIAEPGDDIARDATAEPDMAPVRSGSGAA